jgi:hypothetical protein
MGTALNSAHGESHSRGSEAPTLLPGQELYIWRKAVAEWVDLVHTAATQSEDRHFRPFMQLLADCCILPCQALIGVL